MPGSRRRHHHLISLTTKPTATVALYDPLKPLIVLKTSQKFPHLTASHEKVIMRTSFEFTNFALRSAKVIAYASTAVQTEILSSGFAADVVTVVIKPDEPATGAVSEELNRSISTQRCGVFRLMKGDSGGWLESITKRCENARRHIRFRLLIKSRRVS